MTRNDNSENPRWSRRKLIGTGAGALTWGLAGCTGDGNNTPTSGGDGGDGGGGGDGDGGDGGQQMTFTHFSGRSPTEIQFNIFSQANYGHTFRDHIQHYVAYGTTDGGVTSGIVENFSAEGKTLTLEFSDEFSWWNGDDLTAEDYWTFLEIDRLQNPEESPYAEHNLVDDYTMERVYKKQVTPSLMKGTLTSQRYGKMCTPKSIYQEYLERLQDASSQSERDSVTKDLKDFNIPIKQLAEDGLGNGLYKVVDWSDNDTIFEKYEDHPNADQTDIDRVRMVKDVGMENKRARIINDEFDMNGSGLIGKPSRQDYPDHLQNWAEIKWFRTQKLTFNWENEHLAKRPVRRAIAHALNLQPMVQAAVQAGLVGKVPQVQSGLRSSIHEKFLGEGWVDQLIDYPTGGDTEGAAELMRQAGYSKPNDTWQDENGNPVELSFLTSDGQHQSAIGVVVSDQLESFGFNMDVTTVGSSDFYQTLENYDHDMWWVWHVAQALWHPISYFSNNFYGVEVGNPSSDAETGVTGIPFELTIPSEVGAEEVSGSGQTIRPAQLMQDLAVASTEEEVTNMTRTLVQWFNYDLPCLVWIEENSGSWGDVEDYNFPSLGEGDRRVSLRNARPGQEALIYGLIDEA